MSDARKENFIEKLITESRNAFLKLDSKSENKLSDLPKGVQVKPLKGLEGQVNVCTVEHNGKKYKIFGIEEKKQAEINIAKLKSAIAAELNVEAKGFSQIVGDSYPFDEKGTLTGEKIVSDFLKSVENDIVLYGTTGRQLKTNDGTRCDANGIVNHLLDQNPKLGQRMLGNIVDKHTVMATKDFNPPCTISENLTNYILVYSNTPEPQVEFGKDIISDLITDHSCLCLDGGVQSLKQLVDQMMKDILVMGYVGLRNSADKNNRDPQKNLPYLSAVEFLAFAQAWIEKNGNSNVKNIESSYFADHALFVKKQAATSDSGTKKDLYTLFKEQFFGNEAWKKLNNFKLVNHASSKAELSCSSTLFNKSTQPSSVSEQKETITNKM